MDDDELTLTNRLRDALARYHADLPMETLAAIITVDLLAAELGRPMVPAMTSKHARTMAYRWVGGFQPREA